MFRQLIVILFSTALVVRGFTSAPLSNRQGKQRVLSHQGRKLSMVTAPSESFGDGTPDDFFSGRVRDNDDEDPTKRFLSGDEFHRLRHEVLAMRLELQQARQNGSKQKVKQLERAIMKAQQVDAEFVYTLSLERKEMAEKKGMFDEASMYQKQAMEARSALPHFNLEGLWVGKYGDHGYEMINVTYTGDLLTARKVTGMKNVPKGQVTFQVDLSPSFLSNNEDVLEPIELGDSAARQWGCKYLQRFAGQGQVANEGYHDSQWLEGQMIMVNEYFSFAWLPIGHQVFFGRPTPELVLKLMKDDRKGRDDGSATLAHLERCWEETEHIEDDIVINDGPFNSLHQNDYYEQQGCFE